VASLKGPHRQGVRFISFTKSGSHCATSSDDMLIIWKCGATVNDVYVRIKMLDLSTVPHSLLQVVPLTPSSHTHSPFSSPLVK
jgi:hypothetical protein